MMELFKTRKPARGHMPVKRSINLATVGEKPINPVTAVPAVVIVVILAVLLSKFAVTDRFAKVAAMQREVSQVQKQVDEVTAALDEFGELTERYAHYTYTGFTADELTRTDRIKIMDLVERKIMPSMVGASWSVSGNQMVINIQDLTLEDINQMVQDLEAEELVDYCTVTTARKSSNSAATDPVVASVILNFKPGDATVRYVEEEDDGMTGIEMVDTLDRRREIIEAQGVE